MTQFLEVGNFFFKMYVFLWPRDLFHLQIILPNKSHNSHVFARPKPGASSSIYISHMGDRVPVLGAIFHHLPSKRIFNFLCNYCLHGWEGCMLRWSWWRWRGPGTQEGGWYKYFSYFFFLLLCPQGRKGRRPYLAVKLHKHPGIGDSHLTTL